MRDGPCLELIIVSSNFQALILLRGISLKAINSSKKVLKIAGCALSRINSVVISARTVLGKSKRGLANGGLSPKFSEKIGQKSFRENRAPLGLIGAFSVPIGAFLGLSGTDSSTPHWSQPRGGSRNSPERAFFWAQVAPFGLSPRLLSPPFGFP